MASTERLPKRTRDVTGEARDRGLSQFLASHYQWLVLSIASFVFLTGAMSPPYLQDDVDAVQAQIARNMLASGDYVTARLDGVAYMEKAPLKYWLIALSFRIFGVHDWAARLVIALAAITLTFLTARFAAWAMGALAGFYAGLVLSTSIGLFLFTRILIPDSLLTVFITLATWSFLRALDPDESRARWWARLFWISTALGLLTKGLIGVLFPVAAAILYLAVTRQLFQPTVWRRLLPVQGILLFVLIAAPWHIFAILANPPYFDFTLHSERGSYHGFFWFYFINEQLLRFLNLRYPRDYNTVPRALFWLLHLVWFFPWSAYLWNVRKLNFKGSDRASRTRLFALCLIGFVLVFFTFSTTQEYYSLPCYPAIAMLLGAAMLDQTRLRAGARVVASVAVLAALAIMVILWSVRGTSTPGDIARALSTNPELYSLSTGHFADLTLRAFAYLRVPLALAFCAALIGAIGGFILRGPRAILAIALMMILFFQAARVALHVFDPYLGTEGLAEALLRSPEGKLIVDDEYYSFSTVFFYANKTALLTDRVNNLVYGSFAPDAPQVFIDENEILRRWTSGDRWYLIVDGHRLKRMETLLGPTLHQVAETGNKYLFVNQ